MHGCNEAVHTAACARRHGAETKLQCAHVSYGVFTHFVGFPCRQVYKITTIIGAQIGLGVENLCGSGAIAGETARAYKSTFTITFCSGRSVGIGAYLTRLGQRVIQKSGGAP